LLGLVDSDGFKMWSTICHTKYYSSKKIKNSGFIQTVADETCNKLDSSINPDTNSKVMYIATAGLFYFAIAYNL